MDESHAMRPLRIFVLENHADTLRWLKLYLEEAGHTVVTARSLAEAVVSLPAARCEVLLCDIGLPDGSGWDLLKRVELPRPLFAIAMSGFGMNNDRARSEAAGYRHHLLKPFNMSQLDKLLAESADQFDAA